LSKTIHTERHRKLRELLVARRKAAGLTQTVVAERLGKPPSYVAKYEGGDRRLDVLEFLDVAAAIGFEPCALMRSLLRK
jgi:transcriptional regulator with XRE-family HTH domain